MSRDGPEPARAAANSDEAELLAALRRGEGRAFEDLVRREGPRLLATARRLLRHEEDARDAVQEAFLAAFRSLDDFRAGSRLSTWLHSIVINAALMKLRTRKRHPEEPADAAIEPWLPPFAGDGHHGRSYGSWPASPERALERRETREQVRASIDRLPETFRAVLLLRDIEGLSTAETADVLGATPNAVKVRLHRARQALRTLLEPQMVGRNG